MQVASQYRLLDRVLAIYGPQAAEVRGELRALIEALTRSMWSDNADIPAQINTKALDAFYVALLRLEARDDAERALKAQAVNLIEIGQLRSLMLAESTTSISTPMLIVVVLWLVIIFLGFSLMGPPNTTANFALITSALCAAGAIF